MGHIKCVLLDIEGTVCPISFVKETLFPYALRALPHVLETQWTSPALAPYLAAFPEDVRESPETLQAHVEDLTRRDVKVAALKNLQGYLWEEGYRSGAYATTLFEDVVPALRAWQDAGIALAIYSSGSVFAQKLLFGHVRVEQETDEARKRGIEEVADSETAPAKVRRKGGETVREDEERDVTKESPAKADGDVKETQTDHAAGGLENQPDSIERPQDPSSTPLQKPHPESTEDLTHLFEGWFDTTNAGLKADSDSYRKIAEHLKFEPQQILFLSDNVKEVDAAIQAGMDSIVVDRPGNAPLTSDDKERLRVVDDFGVIDLHPSRRDGATDKP